jgi:sarcosine oxidase subunit alpha
MVDPSPPPVLFRGRPLALQPGETLLTALGRSGFPRIARSIRYHRPRGPFCGVGFCTQCLVRVNGVPNVRACRYVPRPGDRITTENAWPSPAFDLLGVLDPLLPNGLDTLHGLRRPAFFRPLYHRVVRRLSGHGELPRGTPPASPPAEELAADLVIIGAGPAGRSAAEQACTEGLRPMLLDRGALLDPPEGVDARPGTMAVFLPPPRPGEDRPFRLLATDGPRAVTVSARRVIVATGAYDANLLFTGNDRPGVMTAEGAIALQAADGSVPFRRALVVGGGRRALEMMRRFGPRIAAVTGPGPVHGSIAEAAAHLGVPVHPRSLLLAAEGRARVRSVRLRHRGGGEPSRVEVDAVLLAHRRLPHSQLLFQSGTRMGWRGGIGAYYPVLDESFRTSVPGLFVAGEAAGFAEPSAIVASGRAAAEAALGRPTSTAELPARVDEAGPGELEGYYRELFGQPAPRGKCVACPCEDVLLRELEEAHGRGYQGIEVMKRYTSLWAGLCQGRYCVPEAILLLSAWEGRPPAEVGYITQRPPVLPTSLGALAGLPEEAPDPVPAGAPVGH